MRHHGFALALSSFFALNLVAAPLAAADSPAPSPSAIGAFDTALWAATTAGGKAIDYEAYLDRFPEGRYADVAEARLADLKTTKAKSVADARRDEAAIELDRAARRDIQERLAVLGHGAGGVDGLFGPATRKEIKNWQAEAGISVTGYLDLEQISRLVEQTEGRIAAWREERRAAERRAEERRAEERRLEAAKAPEAPTTAVSASARPATDAETGPEIERIARVAPKPEPEVKVERASLIAFAFGPASHKSDGAPEKTSYARSTVQQSRIHDEVGCQR